MGGNATYSIHNALNMDRSIHVSYLKPCARHTPIPWQLPVCWRHTRLTIEDWLFALLINPNIVEVWQLKSDSAVFGTMCNTNECTFQFSSPACATFITIPSNRVYAKNKDSDQMSLLRKWEVDVMRQYYGKSFKLSQWIMNWWLPT